MKLTPKQLERKLARYRRLHELVVAEARTMNTPAHVRVTLARAADDLDHACNEINRELLR